MYRAVIFGFLIINACIGYADDKDYFAERRHILLERIGNSVAVLRGMPDTREYIPFRQDNNFYYLTGVETPGAMLLLDGSRQRSILFLPSRDEGKERWEGVRLYPGLQAQSTTGMDAVMELSEFDTELEKRMEGVRILYTPFMPYEAAATSRDRALQYEAERRDDTWDGRKSREDAFRDALQEKFDVPVSIRDVSPFLDEMRRVKDGHEIDRLRSAGRIGSLGLKEAIRSTAPGMYEYQLAAVAEFVYLWHGASGNAFFPIVGSGPNSCIPHYYTNQRMMEAGDIVVMDFGPDYGYYESDITRTFPVSGRFDPEQAKVYGVVLEAQKAALRAIRPGSSFKDIEDAAEKVLQRHGYDKYKIHAVSHYVGMAVHDVGESERLEPGVVIAVEPGVYIQEKNLGIRIEDTVLVTEKGYEVLTGDVPKEIDEIEKLMASESLLTGFDD